MKINWGTGIAIAIICFMAFIMFFVIRVQSDHKFDNELVVEDYYKMEGGLPGQIAKEENAAGLTYKVAIDTKGDSIKVVFPANFDAALIKGKVSLYRPSNKKLDFEIPISITAPYLLIPKSDLAGGRWDIIVDWDYQGRGYMNSEKLLIE